MKKSIVNKFNLKVGIIGCGQIARIHLRYISEYVSKDMIALCDKDLVRLEDFAQKSGVKNMYSEMDQLLRDFKPDVVHILTPPASHKAIAVKCLESGAHVFIEKPICITTEEADAIIAAGQKANRLVCVDHMRLFESPVIKAKEILRLGKIGGIVNVSAGYSYDFLKRVSTDPAGRWIKRLPGGAFFDVMPHPLCLLAEFLPEIKLEKSFYIKDKGGIINELQCIFSSGNKTGTLHMSLNIFPLKNYLTIEGTRGVLHIDFRNFIMTLRRLTSVPNFVERITGNFSVGRQISLGTVSSMFKFLRGRLDPYAGQKVIIEQLYGAVVNNGVSPVTAQDARKLLELTRQIFADVEKEAESSAQEVKFSPADILVTGGTGFIGHWLVRRLVKEGYRVRVLSHRNLSAEEMEFCFGSKDSVEVVSGDIYNYQDVEKACSGVRAVYHLAAALKGDWNYHLDTTITGTRNILTAAAKTGVTHFIYASTLNVYNAHKYPHNGSIDENFPFEEMPEKRGAYSHAKLKAEQLVREYMDKGGMAITVFRPGLVYGQGAMVFGKDIGIRIGKRIVVVLGLGFRKLPFVYVDNLVDALVAAGKLGDKARGIFNVVDEDYPTQRQFIGLYKKLTGERFFTIYMPQFLIFSMFWIMERAVYLFFKKSIFLCYKLSCVNKNVRHSMQRAKEALGWRQNVPFEKGLTLVVNK